MSDRPRMGRRATLILPGLLIAGSRPAHSASLEIAPVLLDLPVARPASVLNVLNSGDSSTRLQLRAFIWVQENGQDRLVPTDSLIASPPQFALDARNSQVVRIALRRPSSSTNEAAFRILVDELPQPEGGGRVSMLLRVSLPVFASPVPGLLAAPEFAVQVGSRSVLRVRNAGSRRTLLSDLRVGGMEARTEGPGYVLAGVERLWTLPGSLRVQPGSTVRLTGMRDGVPFDVPVRAS